MEDFINCEIYLLLLGWFGKGEWCRQDMQHAYK